MTTSLIKVKDWNAYVHLPDDYDASKSYPALLFTPGLGEIGTDANRLLWHGPSAYVGQGWDGKVNGAQFIVISLQPPTAWPRPWTVKERVDKLRDLYSIGILFLTGLSMGGWVSLWYSYYYPSEVDGVIGVESVVPVEGDLVAQKSYDDTYKAAAYAGQRYLLFEQINDWRRNNQVITAMNNAVPNSGFYQETNFGNGGHCCWEEFYGGGGKEPTKFNIAGLNQTLYEWAAGAYVVMPIHFVSAARTKQRLRWKCNALQDGNYFVILKNGKIFERVEADALKSKYSIAL